MLQCPQHYYVPLVIQRCYVWVYIHHNYIYVKTAAEDYWMKNRKRQTKLLEENEMFPDHRFLAVKKLKLHHPSCSLISRVVMRETERLKIIIYNTNNYNMAVNFRAFV